MNRIARIFGSSAVRDPGAAAGTTTLTVNERSAHRVTLAYLLLTLPLLFWRTRGPFVGVIAMAHVAAAAALWWSLREPATPSKLADWLPLLLVPFLYGELPYLIGDAALHDHLVQQWEAAIFGGQPARTLAAALPNLLVSEVLHFAYLLYYPIVYVPPVMLYLIGRRAEFARVTYAMMLTYVICFSIFALFPVEGPRYAWGAPPSVPNGLFRSGALAILERGSSRGTAFPSSHAAVASVQAVLTLRYQPGFGVVVAATSALLMAGAVYGGFHYAVDILVGALVGILVAVGVAGWPARS